MLSIELIRTQPEYVETALLKRGHEVSIRDIVQLDQSRRQLVHQGDQLRARRNEVAQQIGRTQEKPPELLEEMRRAGDDVKRLEREAADLEASINNLLLGLPNLPQEGVPEGTTEDGNVVLRTWGDPPCFDFTPTPHWDLGEKLDVIDFQRGVKLSGSRFFVLAGMGAKLERALISWMLDLHVTKHGYKEVYLPAMVKREVMEGSGNLPKFASNLYHDDEDDLWLIPTAEVPLTGFHSGEILAPGSLPLNYTAFTQCFRREKAAAGKDTRGIKRVHQFDKVEMYKLVEPERSDEELQRLLSDAEDICQGLELPYRVVALCAGELGFASAKSYDLEMYAPGCDEWLEVSSCSNCTDFQARRAGIRYRAEAGARPAYVHTLNGSGLALPRVVIAILENYQQRDGSVTVPEVLRPYTCFDVIPAP